MISSFILFCQTFRGKSKWTYGPYMHHKWKPKHPHYCVYILLCSPAYIMFSGELVT